MTKALYTGSFDPIHFGHIDAIKRVAKIFDYVIVGMGINPDKKYTFNLEERLDMVRRSLSSLSNVRVGSFQGLTVDYAYEQGIPVIVKGVRNSEDFSYEQMLHQVGESQRLGVESFVLFSKPELAHLSSGAVRALQKEHGFVHEYVPLYVKQKLEEKIAGQYILGITGEIGAGKSYVGKRLEGLARNRGVEAHNIELDNIGHQILEELKEDLYENTRRKIIEEFGESFKLPGGMIDRKALGEIVFNDSVKMNRLNEFMYHPLLARLRREIYGKRGLIFMNAALLAESNMTYLCNNNVIIISADGLIQEKRLKERGLSLAQIRRRKESQYSAAEKIATVNKKIEADNYGKLWLLDNSQESGAIEKIFGEILNNFNLGGKNG